MERRFRAGAAQPLLTRDIDRDTDVAISELAMAPVEGAIFFGGSARCALSRT